MKIFLMFLGCLVLSSCGDTTTYFLENTDTDVQDTDSVFLSLFVLEEEDAGTDSSVDIDTDTDSDTDVDADIDADIDVDVDTDTDTDTESVTDTGETCPYDCITESICEGSGGYQYSEYFCEDEKVCCLIEVDTGNCPYDCTYGETFCDVMGGDAHYGFDCGSSEEVCCQYPSCSDMGGWCESSEDDCPYFWYESGGTDCWYDGGVCCLPE